MIGNLNEDLLLRKALLKNTNQKHIDEFEEAYMTNLYGDFYSQLTQHKTSVSLFALYDSTLR